MELQLPTEFFHSLLCACPILQGSKAIDSSQQEENGGIEMTRLLFTTIAYLCTTRTDTQNAHYPIRDGQILRFQ